MPSVTNVVFQLALYGEVASVAIVVHVDAPAGERSNVTCCTAVDGSEAVAESVIVPMSGVPGSVRETVGLSVSTLTVVEIETALPTLSVPVRV